MSTAADRKAELEQKKERLRALREEKFKREELRRQGLSGISNTSSSADLRDEADALLKNLGIGSLKEPNSSEMDADSIGTSEEATKPFPIIKKPKKLQYCLVSEFDVQPHPRDSYAKETQTVELNVNRDLLTYDDSPIENDGQLIGSPYDDDRSDAKMLKSVHGEIPKQSALIPKEELQESALVELTEEQKQQMLLSEGFRTFFDRSARIVERALCEKDQLFQDYTNIATKEESQEELLPHILDLYAEHWNSRRAVVDLDWSPVFPELLLAAYSANEEAAGEPAGCCMVWNLKFPTRGSPEFRFHCNEPITAAAMVRFHPNLVIGGTYSGQVVLWDSRSNKRTPVQRSTFTTLAHTQPVNSVQVIGSQNVHNAITLSSDGTMCSWSLDMLGAPREHIRVCEGSATPGSLFDLYPTCMAFFSGDQNNFVVGTESGSIYTDQRHSTVVTGIATHPSSCAISFSHIFLSSSLDWTVRLWSVRDHHTPLHTFDDYSECVYGVDWSPIHPALFVAVDGSGRLDVWNLIEDIEVPTARWLNKKQWAMNKVKWDTTGQYIAAGDDEGRVHVCAVAGRLAVPGAEDATRLAQVFAGLKSASASLNQNGLL
ncbi:Cytoplasmic dynein 1 intermediate chain [Echinococcus granulosus]|uniref:Cytoplasmic dynein 1 intermediate chain n=1 Tax=Echinococcus granulosus TaxID=6210 RepID=W6U5B5_ECHGR|nr:Cytoplasmic dynein 1 intermediate chain [Echinococcus granulosus]EUB55746.1 Cytoplasmic dynein 1 intermediate chain [Echinococcus granulosus]